MPQQQPNGLTQTDGVKYLATPVAHGGHVSEILCNTLLVLCMTLL